MNHRGMLYITLFAVAACIVWLIVLVKELLGGGVETMTLVIHGILALVFGLAALMNFIGYRNLKKNQKK